MDYIDPLDRTDLKEEGLFKFLKYEVGAPVTRSLIHEAIIRREIVPTKFGRNNWFSRRDGLNYLAGLRDKRDSVARYPRVNAV